MDQTVTIRASVNDTEKTLMMSVLLVILVVFCFLGNARTRLISSVAVPVSLIGTFGVMYLFGYSLDNLSLMALTISTGFVVDDAIVVTENVTPIVKHLPAIQNLGSIDILCSDKLLAVCDAVEIDGHVNALDPAARSASAEAYRRLSADGLRVLAVAYRALDVRDAYSRDDESHLVLAGFIGFADPIIEDVAAVLEGLRRDGVTVKILTGDNPNLAQYVCRSIGLDQDRVVTGDDIAGLDDGALGHLAEQGAIFARVSPGQKNQIILALKRPRRRLPR